MRKLKALTSILLIAAAGLSAQQKTDTLSIENYRIDVLNITDRLKEISSLAFYNGYFWGNNDSGGKNEIYKIDSKTGSIVQTVVVTNAVNTDWEEISFGGDYVFIADTGNNMGDRKDLAVYYFPVSKLDSKAFLVSVEAQKIEFVYPEQKNFSPGNHKTNFDCEALFFHNGKLHLFTKEWTDQQTTHYTLEVKPGRQQAKKIETFRTNYMVTGATVDDNPISNTHGFYLIGYTPFGISFISGFSLPGKDSELLFSGKTRFSLPLGFTPQVGQTEGITIKPDNPNILCYSNEDFKHRGFHVKQSIQCIQSLAK